MGTYPSAALTSTITDGKQHAYITTTRAHDGEALPATLRRRGLPIGKPVRPRGGQECLRRRISGATELTGGDTSQDVRLADDSITTRSRGGGTRTV